MAAALPECYHGPMTKKECEDLLGAKNKDGAYLIRESESIQGALCLCIYKQKVVYTYRILQGHNGNYTLLTTGGLPETYFKTLGDLIRNYKRKNQGLATHLRHAVKKKTPWLIQPLPSPVRPPRVQPGVSPEVPSRASSGASSGASSREPPRASSREPPRASSAGHVLQRKRLPLPDEDQDYENVPSSEYVEVLPDAL
ncbi:SH2 domain-containing protein 1B [Austrofundulus limnaeus]|uniref:SH2 domain-containing protein 1B n=1 Tax=Austrofundulus limnaeus TaxID=52670 RepID=A0A2I4CTC1_AUSLI|nr:PREDICTED: SH2 domain-containing protein 1B-like [Austrofundulus limnaeus]